MHAAAHGPRGAAVLAVPAFLAIAIGCGAGVAPTGESRAAVAVRGMDASADGAAGDASADTTTAWMTLDEIASRAPSVAAGMREEKRQELDSRGTLTTEVARATTADLCVRVSLVATKLVHAWLEDARAASLADAPNGTRAILGARGPVCIRKGDAVVLRAEGREPFTVRVVTWASP